MSAGSGGEVVAVILVQDYDPAWSERFDALRDEYAAALAARGVPARIEHVGSTSVVGLAAKPVIDVDVVVAARDVAAATEAMTAIGFVPRGELGVPQRYAFHAPARLGATHTYVVVDGCLSLRNHLGVLEVLRTDIGLRDEYAAVKRDAALRAADIDAYVELKSDVLQRILAAAGIEGSERAEVERVNRATAPRQG